jgi:hypothetical protein
MSSLKNKPGGPGFSGAPWSVLYRDFFLSVNKETPEIVFLYDSLNIYAAHGMRRILCAGFVEKSAGLRF